MFISKMLTGLMFILLQQATAAEPLTIQNALKEARTHNPEVQKLKAVLDGAAAKRKEAFAGFLPRVGLNATHFLGAKYAVLGVVFAGNPIQFPSAYPQTNIELEASLLLFDGLGTWHRYQAADLNYDAAELDLSRVGFRLDAEIQKKFDRALASSELAEVAKHNIETLEDHLRLAQLTARAGYSTRFEVLRIEAQLEEARAEKVLDDDNVALARQEFFLAMGLEKDDGRPLKGSLREPDEKNIPSKLQMVTTDRQDYQAQIKRSEATEKESQASYAVWFPKISLFASENYYKFGTFDPAILSTDFLQAYSYGLRLTWELFDGGASTARITEAVARSRESELATREALLKSSQEFELWHRRFIYNAILYRARVRSVAKSEESVRLAKAGLRAGARTHTEVLDAELDLFRSRAGVVRAELDASEALANLELAVGKKLVR